MIKMFNKFSKLNFLPRETPRKVCNNQENSNTNQSSRNTDLVYFSQITPTRNGLDCERTEASLLTFATEFLQLFFFHNLSLGFLN